MNAKTPRRQEEQRRVSRLRLFRSLCSLPLIVAAFSCAPRSQQPSPTPRTSNAAKSPNSSAVDACAAKLHDLSGLLLEYYAQYGNLPDTLNDVPGITPDLMQCDGRAFIYRSEGIPVEGALGGRIVVYEPPTMHKERWGILIVYPREGQPLSARVVAVPENIK